MPRKINNQAAIVAALKPVIQVMQAAREGCIARPGAADTGHEQPVASEIRWFLTSTLQTLHNQMRGRQRAGFYNVTASLTNMQAQYEEMRRAHADDEEKLVLDPRFDHVASWLNYNQVVEDNLTDMEAAFNELYTELTGEQWAPYVAPESGAAGATTVEKDAAAIEAAKKRLAALKTA